MNDYDTEKRPSRDTEIALFQYFVAAAVLWLLTGFWQLQIQNPEVYAEQAAQNSVKSEAILAPRGKLLDRDGRVLVDNAPSFQISMSLADPVPERLALIADGLGLSLEEFEEMLREKSASRPSGYRRVTLDDNLTPAETAFFEARRAELPELELLRSHRRIYPSGGLAAHVIGYVGEISREELDQDEFILTEPGALIGKAGLERQYNDVLVGENGSRLMLVDSRSRRVRDLNVVPATPGRSLRTTLDLDLQVVAELAMEGRKGAVVALDPRNGEILAMVSRPAYDPNSFVGGVSVADWRRWVTDTDKPLINRAIQAQRQPGSIFKPIMALAGVHAGLVDSSYRVHCGGGGTFFGRYFRCHRSAGHGSVGLEEALKHSCNVFFYTLGRDLGIDRIALESFQAGFGRETGVDLPNETTGFVPTSEWKIRRLFDRWYAGETISVAIGQGALTVTPLQAAYAIGGLAMGGVWHRPHLAPFDELAKLRPGFRPPEPVRAEIDRESLDRIVKGMWGVVNDGGTGVRARLPGYDVCGKTGTAQRVSRAFAASSNDPRYRDDGWFVAFAPCAAPEIAVAALFENGLHGSWAAPIARDVLKSYFDKRQRLDWARRQRPTERPRLEAARTAAMAAALRP